MLGGSAELQGKSLLLGPFDLHIIFPFTIFAHLKQSMGGGFQPSNPQDSLTLEEFAKRKQGLNRQAQSFKIG